MPSDATLNNYELYELPALLAEPHGKSGIFDSDISFFTTGFLSGWLEKHGFTVIEDYGVLCVFNHPSVMTHNEDPATIAILHTLEEQVCARLAGACAI